MDNKKQIIKRLLLIFFGVILFVSGALLAGFGTSDRPDQMVMYLGLFLIVISITIVIFNFFKMFDA
jgi:hypothetical protein